MAHRFSKEKLQRYMNIANLNMPEICKQSGLHRDTLNRWFHGRSPSTRCLDNLRSVLEQKTGLNIGLDDLLE